MYNNIPPFYYQKAYAQNVFSKVYDEFDEKPYLSCEEYASLKGIEETEASSLDLDENGKISLYERASQIFTNKLMNEEEDETSQPAMIMRVVAGEFGLYKKEKEFLKELYSQGRLDERYQSCLEEKDKREPEIYFIA